MFLVTAGAGILISCITLFYQNGTNIKTWSAFLAVAITMCVLFAFIYLVVWKSGAGGLNEIQAAGEDVFYYNMNLDISMPKVANSRNCTQHVRAVDRYGTDSNNFRI